MTVRLGSLDQRLGSFEQRAMLALQDQFLRGAIRFTTDRLKAAKAKASVELGDWEQWRDRGKQIRSHTIAHLDYYLNEFASNVEKAGGHVHFAQNAEEAAEIALKIAEERMAKSVAKSKSMVSEEVHINHKFAEHGIEVVETDLGEYIVQLAEEIPSHLIIPAIHKTREQVKQLFTAAGGEGLTTDTAVLTAFARKKMREKFLAADIGMTGCNFAVAEAGSIVLFTNEGNGRMVTTLPRTHIVMMGMERIVPTWADLEVMANLLPRSATGQKLTVYMNILNGPRRVNEVDGVEEMHIIILDNGRSDQLGDPEFQEVLNCIRCGACLNVCPVYRHIGGHAYGWVYSGPIGAVLTPLLQQKEDWSELANASSLCGACHEACPVQIPLHDMLVHLRRRRVEQGLTSAGEKFAFRAWAKVTKHPKLMRFSLKGGRLLQRPLTKNGYLNKGLGPLRQWTDSRDFPEIAEQTFSERWKSLKSDVEKGDNGRG